VIKQVKKDYETDYIEVPSHQHLVYTINGGTRMKQYYRPIECNKVISFSEYYFQLSSGELFTFPRE
jgi:hypothetical protein